TPMAGTRVAARLLPVALATICMSGCRTYVQRTPVQPTPGLPQAQYLQPAPQPTVSRAQMPESSAPTKPPSDAGVARDPIGNGFYAWSWIPGGPDANIGPNTFPRMFEKSAEEAVCRCYSLSHLGDDPKLGQWIVETIPQMIQPDSWKNANGKAN